jgi:hypothetical protein
LLAGRTRACEIKLRNKVFRTEHLMAQTAFNGVQGDAVTFKAFDSAEVGVGDTRVIDECFRDSVMVPFPIFGGH